MILYGFFSIQLIRCFARWVHMVLIAVCILFYASIASASKRADNEEQAATVHVQMEPDTASTDSTYEQAVSTIVPSFSDSLLGSISDDMSRFVHLIERVAGNPPPIRIKLIGLPTWMGYVLLAEGLFVIGLLGWLAFRRRGTKEKLVEPASEEESAADKERPAEPQIGWLGSLRGSLEQHVEEATAQLPEADWKQLEERAEYLRDFRNTVEELQVNMTSDERTSFAVLVEREIVRPCRRLRDLLTLRDIKAHPEDSALLLKGALLSDELLDASALQAQLRRTRPGQMIRYFLPELDKRLTRRDSKLAREVYDALVPLCSGEVQLLTARPGEAFDTSQQHIVEQDTTGAQARNRIVRYTAHGLRDSQTGEVDLKTKVIIAG